MGRLFLLVCVVVLLSAAMANGIRTAVGAAAPAASVAAQQATTAMTPPAVATAATTAAPSDKQPAATDGPYRDSERKVPNGPDPIHNRRARWGEAPARRVL